jgi:YD repeat-containing protein
LSRGVLAEFGYRPFGLLGRTTRYKGEDPVLVSFEYDVRGRQTRVVDPDRGDARTLYNGLGDVRRTIDPAGVATVFAKDRLGRTTYEQNSEGTTSYTWDTDFVGALGYAESPDGVITEFAHDDFGRPESKTLRVAGRNYQISTQYDGFGRPLVQYYPETPGQARFALRHVYSASGYLERLEDHRDGRRYWTQEASTPISERERLVGGALTTRGYDDLTQRQVNVRTERDGDIIHSIVYDYYLNGNVKERWRSNPETKDQYTYDSLNRLETWTRGQRVETYRYNDVDMLTQARVTQNGSETENRVYTYAETDGAGPLGPTRVGTSTTFKYDDLGRRTDRLVSGQLDQLVAWKPFDLPSRITDRFGTITQFSYDAGHQRVLKATGSSDTTYFDDLYEHRRPPSGAQEEVFYVKVGERTDGQHHRSQWIGQDHTVQLDQRHPPAGRGRDPA